MGRPAGRARRPDRPGCRRSPTAPQALAPGRASQPDRPDFRGRQTAAGTRELDKPDCRIGKAAAGAGGPDKPNRRVSRISQTPAKRRRAGRARRLAIPDCRASRTAGRARLLGELDLRKTPGSWAGLLGSARLPDEPDSQRGQGAACAGLLNVRRNTGCCPASKINPIFYRGRRRSQLAFLVGIGGMAEDSTFGERRRRSRSGVVGCVNSNLNFFLGRERRRSALGRLFTKRDLFHFTLRYQCMLPLPVTDSCKLICYPISAPAR